MEKQYNNMINLIGLGFTRSCGHHFAIMKESVSEKINIKWNA